MVLYNTSLAGVRVVEFGTKAFVGQVNWTATYRLDSTLVAPYERFTFFANYSGRLPERAPRDVKADKKRHVAWFVSNCGALNGRQNYVKELQKYIGELQINS